MTSKVQRLKKGQMKKNQNKTVQRPAVASLLQLSGSLVAVRVAFPLSGLGVAGFEARM